MHEAFLRWHCAAKHMLDCVTNNVQSLWMGDYVL